MITEFNLPQLCNKKHDAGQIKDQICLLLFFDCVTVAGQAELFGLTAFQQAVSILGLAFAHQFVTYLVTAKTALAPQCGVHRDHSRVFAVTDRAFKGVCTGCKQ
jgi:hypothetical protein